MKTLLRSATLILLGSGLLAGLTGCELQQCDVTSTNDAGVTTTSKGVCAKSLKKWVGTPDTQHAQWVPGGSVTIDGFNGPITVVKGSGTLVTATFTPVDLRAYDTSDADIQADFKALGKEVVGNYNGAGNVLVKSSQQGSAHSGLGAELKVALPDSFDGELTVTQQNGDTSLHFVGNASSVKVSSKNGEVSGSIGAVPAGGQGGTVITGNGSIQMSFDGSQKFNVQASTLAGGTVDVGNAQTAGCVVAGGGSDSSQNISCGGAGAGDPTYVLKADGTGLANVTLSF